MHSEGTSPRTQKNLLEFNCRRCGKCCKGEVWLRKLIRPADVKRWRGLDRQDILRYVCPTCNRLIDPERDNQPWIKQECPFLEMNDGKAVCKIYDVRPKVCREFPIRKCTNPNCPEAFHFHEWLWKGGCEAAQEFKKALVHAVESKINVRDEET